MTLLVRLFATTLLFAPVLLRSQSVPTIEVETHLIDSTVSVHDSAGNVVSGLTRNDFSVVEDGVPQAIRFFTPAEQLPLSIGLIIDASGSQQKFIRQHERDVESFLRKILQPQDQAFAVCFGNHLRLISDFSGSAPAIVDNIHRFDKGNMDFPEIGPQEKRDMGTALYDAVFYSVTEKLSAVGWRRRKIILIFSDGEDNSSERDLIDAIEAAQTANTLIYSVRYTELERGRMNARNRYGMRALDHLSGRTGGRSFDVRAVSLDRAFAEISDDLRSLYEIAYQSTNRVRDGSYRKVVIQSTRSGLTVRSRTGYIAR
jgi:Ca-activated chloride channel family protein